MRDLHDRRTQRRWLIGTVVTVVVALGVVVGGPWLYAQVVTPRTAAPLALTVPLATPTSSPTPLTVADLEGAWVLDEGSAAGYRIEEVLTGQEVTVVGRTETVTGRVEVADGRLTSAEVTVDVAAVETDEAARDAYARRALDVGTHPRATFVLTEPVDVSRVVEGVPLTVEADGVLTIRGVDLEVTVTLKVAATDTGVEVVGEVPVALEDLGLVAPDLPFVTVQPEGVVEVLLVLTR